MDSLVEKEVLEDASAFVNELKENSEFKVTSTTRNWLNATMIGKQKRIKECQQIATAIKPTKMAISFVRNTLSNHTHYSPTDTDARVSVKPGKARQLNYFGQIAVDDAHHVITGACSDFADKETVSV